MTRFLLSTAMVALMPACALADAGLLVPVNRSSLVTLPASMSEVMVSNPDIADVHAHNPTNLTVVGKKLGQTTIRIFDRDGKVMRSFDVTVGYDLPAIRKALKDFVPEESVGVEMVGTSVALTGQISSALAAEKAVRIAREFMHVSKDPNKDQGAQAASKDSAGTEVINLMQVVSGQQVMLRVRVGEIQREALKVLGVDLSTALRGAGNNAVTLATGGGIAGYVSAASSSAVSVLPGQFLLVGGQQPANTRGILAGRWQPNGTGGDTISGLLQALESDGLFKLLAEPNLVAISGEQAEFLAGGEIPVPVVQNSGGSGDSVSIQYKPFGVSVKFMPNVLTDARIRMQVQPEVSELDAANGVTISGFAIPALSTRRAKTTIELAPGESFMIAGLIKDQTRSTIEQLPGVKEMPILGALFRSTKFRRNETELVIAVTPYLVDPSKSADIKLPTDNFAPSSQMEMFFYGALGTLTGNAAVVSQTPSLEGPIGFMVD